MVGGLMNAERQFARDTNSCERNQSDARIAEIEQLDLADPAAKKMAFEGPPVTRRAFSHEKLAVVLNRRGRPILIDRGYSVLRTGLR
ncbi:hypothetical protein LH464_10760 [Neorhizobium sp. T786]|uniref:hypothetical protein n=1 Tax=Pseudorhizobium xiangyangii TaxID=2883104 RepID=UPI001CFF76A7|nr:hypothetical protein [Neorhizobium xiangyangii]MCB5202950.1 hypothetical protein [Neorhizobium xiangyangii]